MSLLPVVMNKNTSIQETSCTSFSEEEDQRSTFLIFPSSQVPKTAHDTHYTPTIKKNSNLEIQLKRLMTT